MLGTQRVPSIIARRAFHCRDNKRGRMKLGGFLLSQLRPGTGEVGQLTSSRAPPASLRNIVRQGGHIRNSLSYLTFLGNASVCRLPRKGQATCTSPVRTFTVASRNRSLVTRDLQPREHLRITASSFLTVPPERVCAPFKVPILVRHQVKYSQVGS
jgi:hypothetical protein